MANYIMGLRKIVGKRPLMMCTAGVLIINERNELLLERRKDNDMWAIIGGAIELGETTDEAVRRETEEEIGVTLGDLELFNIYSGKEQHYTYPNGDEVYVVNTVYIAKGYAGDFVIDHSEVTDVRFFDINNIPENIHLPDIVVIKEFSNKYKNK